MIGARRMATLLTPAPTQSPQGHQSKERLPAAEKPVWVSVNRAIKASSIGRTRIYELIDNGTIDSVIVGRRRLISFASIENLGRKAA
jgi:excisionase family DNA binding protein